MYLLQGSWNWLGVWNKGGLISEGILNLFLFSKNISNYYHVDWGLDQIENTFRDEAIYTSYILVIENKRTGEIKNLHIII